MSYTERNGREDHDTDVGQYGVAPFAARHGLLAGEARKLLRQSGDSRSVADEPAIILQRPDRPVMVAGGEKVSDSHPSAVMGMRRAFFPSGDLAEQVGETQVPSRMADQGQM